jgi:hypothetical protein
VDGGEGEWMTGWKGRRGEINSIISEKKGYIF